LASNNPQEIRTHFFTNTGPSICFVHIYYAQITSSLCGRRWSSLSTGPRCRAARDCCCARRASCSTPTSSRTAIPSTTCLTVSLPSNQPKLKVDPLNICTSKSPCHPSSVASLIECVRSLTSPCLIQPLTRLHVHRPVPGHHVTGRPRRARAELAGA
jgi:hypothetical protein